MARRENPALITHLAREVRRRREANLLTQEQLADRAGIRAQTLSRIENGRTQASIGIIGALAAALGCTMGDLLDPEDLEERFGHLPDRVELTDPERALLRLWRSLSAPTQRGVLAALKEMMAMGAPWSGTLGRSPLDPG